MLFKGVHKQYNDSGENILFQSSGYFVDINPSGGKVVEVELCYKLPSHVDILKEKWYHGTEGLFWIWEPTLLLHNGVYDQMVFMALKKKLLQ